MKTKFICLLGIDGSGKSTLAKLLIEGLDKEDQKFRYIWGGCRHYITYPLVMIGKKILLRGENQFEDYCKYHEKIKKTASTSCVSRIYQNLLTLDYYLQILLRIKIPLILGEGIIVDRYIYGTFIDMAVNLGQNEQEMKNNISKFLKFCPKPDIIFFIDVPEEIAFSRKSDIPSIDYLKMRRKLYISLIDDFRIIRLNGLDSAEELNKISLEILKKTGTLTE